MNIEVALRTDVGRLRTNNEDCTLVNEDLGLFVVCDGMGGHAGGELASDLATRTVLNTILAAAGHHTEGDEISTEESLRIEAVLRSALENANARIRELHQRDPSKRGAGTTCSALLIRGGRGFLAHVGDSRIYLKRHGAMHRMTVDHSLVEHAIQQGMAREKAEAEYPSNALVRAIGPYETVLVDTLVFDVLPADVYLLCSDGLHEYFPDDDELRSLLDHPAEVLVDELIDHALERGGRDNITAMVVRIGSELADTSRTLEVSEDLSALWQLPLFNDLSYQELLEIVDVTSVEFVDADRAIISEGETSDHLYVVSSGTVRVSRGDDTIAELGPGSHFGEMGLLTNRPRTATVRAVEATRVLAMAQDDVIKLFARRPAIGMKFLWKLAQVQSIRLDEAQIWRELGADPTPAPKVPLGDLESTVRINPAVMRTVADKALKREHDTIRLLPPPLSRHRS